MIAKQIVKNKFWIVEKDGRQVATIQATPSGVAFVQDNTREQFVSINVLRSKYNITISKDKKPKPEITFDVHGFPCDHRPHNALYDVSKRLPVYTKTEQSKSFFCAGHYLVKYSESYVYAYCPKLITLNRNEFAGPFRTQDDAKDFLRKAKQR